MNCTNPDCGENSVISEMTPQGIKRRCNKCGMPIALEARPVPLTQSVEQPALSSAVASQRKAIPTALTSKTLIRDARTRVAELNREIKHLKSLIQERDALRRLLAAAKKQPKDGGAVVRPLRKQG